MAKLTLKPSEGPLLKKQPKSPKAKQPKKKSVAQLKKEADKWVSQAVRLRDSELVEGEYIAECITCGVKKHWKQMQCGHFVSRKVSTLRYDEINIHAQCVGCNMFKAGEQYAYAKAVDKLYGDGTADALFARRTETHKFTVEELEQIISDSKAQVRFYLDAANK